jgi:hypothetical protein
MSAKLMVVPIMSILITVGLRIGIHHDTVVLYPATIQRKSAARTGHCPFLRLLTVSSRAAAVSVY